MGRRPPESVERVGVDELVNELAMAGDVITFHGGVAIRAGARISRATPPKSSWPPWYLLASHVGCVGVHRGGNPPCLYESTTLNTELDVSTKEMHRGVAEVNMERRLREALGAGQRVMWRSLKEPMGFGASLEAFYEAFRVSSSWKYVDWNVRGIWKLFSAEFFDYINARTPTMVKLGPKSKPLQVICSEYVALLHQQAGYPITKMPKQHSPTDWVLDYDWLNKPIEVVARRS